jgi:hypothetical protein
MNGKDKRATADIVGAKGGKVKCCHIPQPVVSFLYGGVACPNLNSS